MRETELEEFGVRSGGRTITDMRYADDTLLTLLIVDGGKSPSDALKKLDDAGRKRGLILNQKRLRRCSQADDLSITQWRSTAKR